MFVQSHRIHRIGIFTYIWLIFMVNVGKYTIHGSYGNASQNCFFWSGLFISSTCHMSQDIPLDDDPAPRRHLLAAALASAIVDVEGMWCPISEG